MIDARARRRIYGAAGEPMPGAASFQPPPDGVLPPSDDVAPRGSAWRGEHGGDVHVDITRGPPPSSPPPPPPDDIAPPADKDAPWRDEHDRPPAPLQAKWEAELAAALVDVKRGLGEESTTVREPLFYPAVELFRREYPPTSWLVTGLATRGGLVMIGGEPKTLKTWLATAIAVAVSSGTKVCGEFQAAAGVVAYFYAEDLDRQVRNRLRAHIVGADLDPPALARLYLRPRGKFLDVTKDEDLAWIVASCRRLGNTDMLVLDPLRDISSAAEDKSDEMSPVLRRLRLLGELLDGCTITVVHHTAKLSENSAKRRPGQRLRGSSAIHGSVDSGIYLSDLDGDGSNTFHNIVDSEIKGARSAGRFELALVIEDDENGEAIKATWSVSRDGGPQSVKAHKDSADDEAALGFVRELAMQGQHLSARALRDHDGRPIPEKRFVAAIDRLVDAGRLVKGGDYKLRLPEPGRDRRERDSDDDGASGATVGQTDAAPSAATGGAVGQPPYRGAPQPAPEVPHADSHAWGNAASALAPCAGDSISPTTAWPGGAR